LRSILKRFAFASAVSATRPLVLGKFSLTDLHNHIAPCPSRSQASHPRFGLVSRSLSLANFTVAPFPRSTCPEFRLTSLLFGCLHPFLFQSASISSTSPLLFLPHTRFDELLATPLPHEFSRTHFRARSVHETRPSPHVPEVTTHRSSL
jgi:hypothetical protein